MLKPRKSPSLPESGLPPAEIPPEPLGAEDVPVPLELDPTPAGKAPYFPRPPGFKPNFARFCDYWGSIHRDERFRDRGTVYVYRLWPIINRKQGGTETNNIDKVTEPFQNSEDVLHRYGSGDYRFILNDHVHRKAICKAELRGLRENEHPPVLKLEELVLTDPANASYIDHLKLKGVRIPGLNQEEEDVSGKAIEQLVSTVDQMAQRNATLAERMAHPPLEPQGVMVAEVTKATVDAVRSATETANKITETAVSQALALQSRQGDSLAVMDTVLKLAEKLAGGRPEAAEVMKLVAGREEGLRAELAQLQAQLYKAHSEHLQFVQDVALGKGKTTETPAAPASFSQQIEELVRTKETLGDLLGIAKDAPLKARRSGDWTDHLPLLIQGAALISNSIANAIYNSRLGAGAAPAAPPQLAPVENPKLEPPAAEPEGAPNTVQEYLVRLRGPLLRALQQGKTGDEFAEDMIRWEGEVGYLYLREMGKEAILALLASYPPIWSVVAQIPTRFEQFLGEFFSYEPSEEETEQGEPAAIPVIAARHRRPVLDPQPA